MGLLTFSFLFLGIWGAFLLGHFLFAFSGYLLYFFYGVAKEVKSSCSSNKSSS